MTVRWDWSAVFWQLTIVVCSVGAWHWAALDNANIRDAVGTPDAVLKQLVQWILNGEVFYHLAITALEAAYGFLAGTIVGISVGFVLTFVPLLRLID